MTQNSKERALSRLKLLFIATIFFGPLVVAATLYYGFPEWIPAERTEQGHLVNPAQRAPALDLRTAAGTVVDAPIFGNDRWTFLYFATGPCEKTCHQRLYDTRQVRTALGGDANRVQRVYIASDSDYLPDAQFVKDRHVDLKLYTITGDKLQQFLDKTVQGAGANGDVYVLDPLGNWVLYYQPQDAARGLLDDMKHLLKLSHVG